MKKTSNRLIATLLSIAFTATIFLLPFTAGAVTGTLGTESPALTARFKDSTGSTVDGNTLTAGTYTVDIVLSGMQSISMFQMTANYGSNYISSLTVNSVYSDDASTATESCGVLNEEGKLVFGFISTNDDCSPVNSKGTVLATLSVTIAVACDFEVAFQVSDDPECTLAAADFGDGTDAAYTLNKNAEYPMACDMSPTLPDDSYDVSGKIMIATDVTGTDVTGGISGITVSVKVGDETVSATTSEDGTYILTGLPAGEYTMSISGPTTIDRNVALSVTADRATEGVISVDSVGIIVCDYNKDGSINGTDAGLFSDYLTSDYYIYADLNLDKSVNGTDAGLFAGIVNQTITYSDVTL